MENGVLAAKLVVKELKQELVFVIVQSHPTVEKLVLVNLLKLQLVAMEIVRVSTSLSLLA